ncbi:uncharacterized protein FIBRA_06072 [Fibroporia radiculosa]|uniref:Uncharacterized protein n=1 Tax=Fibroporia radiculosa TaxID=599839 RepID=J4IB25_9APHY|nr:uncharacterized protein FIBRA_06072 [Fibroporia radiculosa]CCM03921.1 predicted protein [Fibroporia radiculosa]
MVATFILTRAFAISALVFGAFPVAYAAPIGSSVQLRALDGRNCRILGCLIEEPNTESSSASAPVSSAESSEPTSETTSVADEIADLIDIISDITDESSTGLPTTEPVDIVEVEAPSTDATEDSATSASWVERSI